jgi:hypothetical protein
MITLGVSISKQTVLFCFRIAGRRFVCTDLFGFAFTDGRNSP